MTEVANKTIYRVKNWEQFQHYKDRNPPWIKLHFSLLSSSDWVMLDDRSRVLAIAIMLVASRKKGEIDGGPEGLAYLKRVAYLNTEPDLKPLISCGFLECASSCKQTLADDTTEESRSETEREARARSTSKPKKEVFMDHATSGMTGKSKKAVELILELWNGDVAQGPYEQIHAVQVITAAVHYLNGVDVLAEIRAARANWPNDRPVYDAGRNSLHPYLVSWFRNAQERGDRSKTGSQAGHTSKPQGFSLLEIGRHIQIDRPFPEQFGEIVRIINTAVEDGVLMPSQIYSWLDDCAKAENPAFSMRNKKIVDFDPQDNRKPSEIAAGVFRPVSGKRVEDLIASMPIMGKKIGGQK